MFLIRLMILCCTDFLTSWLDSFVRWWCWRIMWSKPDTSAELLRKPKSKSSSLSPLIPPHSHSFFSLIFLLIYPFILFKSGNYVPRQFLNELSSTLIPSGLSGFSFIISYSLHDTEHNFRPFHWNFTTFTFSSSSTLYCNFSLIFSFLFFAFLGW